MTPIKANHWVRTADGTVARVCYVHEATAEADVAPEGDRQQSVTLPLSELRRIPDPRNKRPQITGVPDVRPRCAFCNRTLHIQTEDTYNSDRSPLAQRIIARTFVRFAHYGRIETGAFCRHICAQRFAEAAFRAGYRIVRKET